MTEKSWSQLIEENKEKILEKMGEAWKEAFTRTNLSFDVYLYEDGDVIIFADTSNGRFMPAAAYNGKALLIASYSNLYELEEYDKVELEKQLQLKGFTVPKEEDVVSFVQHSIDETVHKVYAQFLEELKDCIFDETIRSNYFEEQLEHVCNS